MSGGASGPTIGAGRAARYPDPHSFESRDFAGITLEERMAMKCSKRIRVFALAVTVALGLMAAPALAEDTALDDDIDLSPGPTVVKDPDSPTGYTVHFVYRNTSATSVRFVADILLRNWENPADTTVYEPSEYRPGLMRGGGAYDAEMTEVGDGYWVIDVPLAAGANQYWFYVDNNTDLWVTDPANPPIYAPDGLIGNARRAFNKVNVPYDAEKQSFEPMAARAIENPRADSDKGTWDYVPIQVGDTARTLGVYLPPGYDPDRAKPYKTIYMQHGGGQDQSDWMNIGSVPVIMDNLIQDGLTEPAVVVTTNSQYLGSATDGYPNLRNTILPFVESHYNVSTHPMDRAFAGLSLGSIITSNIINFDPTLFGYYGPWSGGVRVNNDTANLGVPYILFGGGQWDFGLPDPTQVAARTNAFMENVVVAGAHDFNAWNQLFTIFARDYLWQPARFVGDNFQGLKADIEGTDLSKAVRRALTTKLDQAYNLLKKGKNADVVEVMNGFVVQVGELKREGKLTEEEAAGLVGPAEKLIFNVGYWL